MIRAASSLISRLNCCLEEILSRHPEIDLYTIKKKGESLDVVYRLINDEQRRDLGFRLLTLFVTKYYPCPENFRRRLEQVDKKVLDRLVINAWQGSEQKKREVLATLLSQDELVSTKLGCALRTGNYPESSFTLSNVEVSDYSKTTLSRAMISLAKTQSDQIFVKKMVLSALQEELAMQLIFLPLDHLVDDLRLISPPSDLTDLYRYDFICPVSQRKISLNLPACYRLTQEACSKISLYIAADLAMSHLLWKWLRVPTCPNYSLIVRSFCLEESTEICRLDHFIDIFLKPHHILFKEDISNCLITKYLSHLNPREARFFAALCQANKEKIACLLAESLLEHGQLNIKLFNEKLKIQLHSSPQLQDQFIRRSLEVYYPSQQSKTIKKIYQDLNILEWKSDVSTETG
jgi:hypothetical protein